MPKKIFVSYKYGDPDVAPLAFMETTARGYVDVLESMLDAGDHIYKGEKDDESLEDFKDETIASKLRDKIFDSSITIVLISKNMKEVGLSENDQWIPWEISYSLKEITREGRVSGTNAMLAVILPDRNGSYDYFVEQVCPNCQSWKHESTFGVIGRNMFNRREPRLTRCPSDGMVHSGNDHSFIYPVKWDNFVQDINLYIELATSFRERMDEYVLSKEV